MPYFLIKYSDYSPLVVVIIKANVHKQGAAGFFFDLQTLGTKNVDNFLYFR